MRRERGALTLGAVLAALLVVAVAAGILAWRARNPTVANLSSRSGPIVVLGDSLAAGVGAEKGGGYVSVLARRLGVEIVNAGVSGNTTAQGLERLQADVLDLSPALVIVELGGNDFLQKVERDVTFANLDTIITRCQQQGAAVLLLGVQGSLWSSEADRRFARLAKERQCAYVSNVLKGLIGQPALMYDSIHPNDAGYERMADRIEPRLRWVLERMGRL